jgi:hypothetical protein
VAEHDPQAFQRLFQSEPDQPSPGEMSEWVAMYARLVEMLERQLDDTRRFCESVPEALQNYLSGENVKILTEELDVFRKRLAHWRTLEA